MRIVTKVSLSEEGAEFDGKSQTKEQMSAFLEFTRRVPNCVEKNSWKCFSLHFMLADFMLSM